uniref:Mobilization protein MobA n=1 Tax=Acinetobacter seifertii TaxID=1530123 RepID=A0A5P1I6B5_9GAMM|nr:mobilization protein MobA [Acinetobacter seifertii]
MRKNRGGNPYSTAKRRNQRKRCESRAGFHAESSGEGQKYPEQAAKPRKRVQSAARPGDREKRTPAKLGQIAKPGRSTQ